MALSAADAAIAHTLVTTYPQVRTYASDAGRDVAKTIVALLNNVSLLWIKQAIQALPAATQAAINGAALYGTDPANVMGFVAFTTTTGESIVARMKP